jgi:hypothetical protein
MDMNTHDYFAYRRRSGPAYKRQCATAEKLGAAGVFFTVTEDELGEEDYALYRHGEDVAE